MKGSYARLLFLSFVMAVAGFLERGQALGEVLRLGEALGSKQRGSDFRLTAKELINLAADDGDFHVEIGQCGRARLQVRGFAPQFQFEQVAQTIPRFPQTDVGRVQVGVTLIGQTAIRVAGAVDPVGVNFGGAGEELLFEAIGIQPGPARFVEQGEVIGHAGKRAVNVPPGRLTR